MAKVTFIMPTIRDRFLDKAILSIVGQTLQDWELIIFNNKVGRQLSYEDRRISVIDTPCWSVPKCFNEGTKMARSNIIMHHCDDDMSFPERAEITYNRIESGADLFCGAYVAVSPHGKARYLFAVPRRMDTSHFRRCGNYIPLFCSGYRRDTAPAYREDFPILHDYTFIYDYIQQGVRFTSTSTPVAVKICHDEAMNKAKSKEKDEETRRIRVLYNDSKLRSDRQVVNI